MMRRVIEVWVCNECDSFYGASSAEGVDLTKELNTDIKNKPTFPRSTCPNCGEPTQREWRYAVVLDFGPAQQRGPIKDEEVLVQEAYRLLREARHESVR